MQITKIPTCDNYGVTRCGKIFSFNYRGKGSTCEIFPSMDKDGYLQIGLYLKKGRKWFRAHRLVAITFLANPYNLPQINHKDGVKFNNHVSNLEWTSNINNQRHAWKLGLKSPKLGSDNFSAILSEEEVKDIKILLKEKYKGCVRDISKAYGVSHQLISDINTGKTWSHIK